ncbi:SDR family oxidoreductase [Agrilactobacillus fermenti]|uniref:SDR family oxidoreductase n=1 Tax=Agrilactobacillus fermenti TaxID=2586909 RepID=UPI001E5E4ADD|nr:SDR family oxidoreductase [Agrilactobacillus fermenti]MCD2256277.1 SDR family oxidoreductase [Agrilactobacillus fermenti]
MKVFVIGAHGKVGQLLLPKLQQAGYEVFAGIRDETQAQTIKSLGATPVHVDLLADVSALAQTLQGMDAVVFTAGSGGSTGDDMTLLIDLDGAVKAMEAAKTAGSRRFVIVSSAASNHRATWGDVIRPYMAAKYYADRVLKTSGLNYTIVRPGILTDDNETKRYFVGPRTLTAEHNTIARADVANFIVTALGTPSTIRQEYDIFNGSEPLVNVLN